MTARDRTVLLVLAGVAVLAAFWFAVLGPKRDEAAALQDEIAAARTRLAAAQTSAAAARRAKAGFREDYATVARLGKAVTLDEDVASLVYQLDDSSRRAGVAFGSVKTGGDGTAATAPATANATPTQQAAQVAKDGKGASTTATTSGTASAPAAAATPVGAAGFTPLPLELTFRGSFFKLQDLLQRLDRYARLSADGAKLTVDGRLLTIDRLSLSASADAFPAMQATVGATAYLLPPGQGLTAGATPAGAGAAGTAPAASGGSSAAPVPTATIQGAGR